MLCVLIRITLAEVILMSTHNIGFYEDLTKIIFELSSNTHLISSAALISFQRKHENIEHLSTYSAGVGYSTY